MSDMAQYILSDMIITPCNLYIWSKLLNKKPDFKSAKTYIILILMAIVTLLNYLYNNELIRIVTITVVMAIFFKILFNEKINKAIFGSVIAQLLYMISEIIFAFALIYIFRVDPNNFETMYFGKILANVIIVILVIILMQFKFVKKFYFLLLKITNKIKYNTLIILLLFAMIAINVFFVTAYYDIGFINVLILNIVLTAISFAIIIYSLYNKNQYINVYDKYNTTLNSLKEYENMLDRYRVSNHENKNELLTIRNMIPKSNKKVISYIDTILENKLKDNDKIMLEASKIPAGGLRGLIYSKILLMKKLNINYNLEISNEVRTTDLIKSIQDFTMMDICKIIGVYLDNAIEEVEKLNKKYIGIEMYLDEKSLIICVSNNYKEMISLDKIEESGYTSKGSGHGYGLSLTKEIIDNNKNLSNEKRINKEIFTQILKIKM